MADRIRDGPIGTVRQPNRSRTKPTRLVMNHSRNAGSFRLRAAGRVPRTALVLAAALAGPLPAVGLRAEKPAAQPDGEWPMPAKTFAATRYSELDQISTENVKSLKVAWTFSTGVNRG